MADTASRVAPVLGLAAHMGRGFQRIATDAVVGRTRSLPRTLDTLDAAYLSRLMGRTVTSVSVIGGDGGGAGAGRRRRPGIGVREDGSRDRSHPADG